MERVRRGFNAAVVTVMAVVAVACGGGGGGTSSPASVGTEVVDTTKDTLVVAINSDPANLSPLFLDINTGNWKVFSGLVQYDQDLRLVPDLAAELPAVADAGRTVTVKLRSDPRFHDGQPFTAADVVFTWNALLDPAVASPLYRTWDLAGLVESVEAVDTHTVRFRLGRPDPAFLDKLYVGIVPEHLLTGQDLAKTDFNRQPVGTGPYKMGERRPGDRMALEANADYYGGPPMIKRIVYTFIPDENARAAALRQGSIDVARLPPRLADTFADDSRLQVVTVPSAAVDQVALPTGNPVLADSKVRRALAMAFDRETAAAGVYGGKGSAASSPFVPSEWGFDPTALIRFDPPAAAKLLDEAGWAIGGDGFRAKGGTRLAFTVMILPNITTHRELALALRSDLAKVGVDVTVDTVDSAVYKDRLATDAWLHNLGNPYDPDSVFYPTYHSKLATDNDPGTNPAAMSDPAVDAALAAGRAGATREERTTAYRALQQALIANGAYLYMGVGNHTIVVPSAVRGLEVQAQGGAHNFARGISWNLERWHFVKT